MKELNAQKIISIVAVVLCLLGFLMTAQSVRAAPQALAQLRRQAADYQKLLALAEQEQRHAAAEQAFEALGRKRVVPLGDLVQSALPGVKADVTVRDTKPLADGWSLRSADITLDDVDLAAVGKIFTEAARVRPPWRVAECAVTPSDRPGAGRVSLLMEAVEGK